MGVLLYVGRVLERVSNNNGEPLKLLFLWWGSILFFCAKNEEGQNKELEKKSLTELPDMLTLKVKRS